MMATEDGRNVNSLKEVWSREENALCADCGEPGKSIFEASGQKWRANVMDV